MESLYNNHGHNVEVYVLIVKITTYDELKFNYEMINKNTPLPDFTLFENVDKCVPETVANHFQLKHPKIWSKTSKARRPHIYFNYFQETLAYICDQTGIDEPQELQDLITNFNDKLCKWDAKVFQTTHKINENQYKSAKEHGFYLGLFSYISCEEYGFPWAKKLVEDCTGKIIKSTLSYSKKKKIPKKIKNDAWDFHVGKNVAIAKCLCCKTKEINAKDFVAGHIMSEYNGGEVVVENLVPICQPCNSSMGVTNMDVYVETYYPQNLDAFLKRDYNEKVEQTGNKLWAYFGS